MADRFIGISKKYENTFVAFLKITLSIKMADRFIGGISNKIEYTFISKIYIAHTNSLFLASNLYSAKRNRRI